MTPIDGVTVLNEVILNGSFILSTAVIVVFLVAVLAFLIGGIVDKDKSSLFAALVALIICLVVVAFTDVSPTYQVAVDDTVLFNDFCKRYEIVERKGDIYTVRLIKGVKD